MLCQARTVEPGQARPLTMFLSRRPTRHVQRPRPLFSLYSYHDKASSCSAYETAGLQVLIYSQSGISPILHHTKQPHLFALPHQAHNNPVAVRPIVASWPTTWLLPPTPPGLRHSEPAEAPTAAPPLFFSVWNQCLLMDASFETSCSFLHVVVYPTVDTRYVPLQTAPGSNRWGH